MSVEEVKDVDEKAQPTVTQEEADLESPNAKHDGDKLLIPQPSDNPLDPLNWPRWKRNTIFGIWCLSGFVGLASPLAHTNALLVQGELYHRTANELAYTLSAAVAGAMVAPVVFVPISRVIGAHSCLFWALLGMLATSTWAAKMDHPGDYIPFMVSRIFNGFCGIVPVVLGQGVVVDLFFLHQRGKAFAIFSTCFILGAVGGPTFDGFIIQHQIWPIEFWWVVALIGVTIILAFIFLEETGWGRDGERVWPAQQPDFSRPAFFKSRMDLFLIGTKVVPKVSREKFIHDALAPAFIAASPATIICGIFDSVNYGWMVVINTLLAIYLQTPYMPEANLFGYGFDPQQNSAFLFALWVGTIAGQIYCYLLNDRIPLKVSARRGEWHPEYRLYTLVFPGLITMPIGLGLFGAALQYHLHYMVLALGSAIISFSAVSSVPMPINYLVESFKQNPMEVGVTLNFYRLLLGLIVPLFIADWQLAVGVGWVFGMSAFFSLFSIALIGLLFWKGKYIRSLTPGRVLSPEEGNFKVAALG